MQELRFKVKGDSFLTIEVSEVQFYEGFLIATSAPSREIYDATAAGDIKKVVKYDDACRVLISLDRFVMLENI